MNSEKESKNEQEQNDELKQLSELKKEKNIQKMNKDNNNKNDNSTSEIKPFNNYGKIKILKYDNNNDPLFVLGPDYIYFFILIFLNLLIIAFFAYVQYCYSTLTIRFFGFLISLIQISIYIYCSLKNPGYPKQAFQDPSLLQEKEGYYRRCKECGIIVDLRKYPAHCYDCKICCEGFDHHCSWSSKCIGSGNIMEFRLFLITFFLLCTYFGISAIWFEPDNNKCRIKFF